MDKIHCPICEKEGLIKISQKILPKRAVTVCSNENYGHKKIGERHFLVRTKENIMAENDLMFHVDHGSLVLN